MTVDFLNENLVQILELVASIIGVAALIAAMTPNETDNKVVAAIGKFFDLLGANWGAASNGVPRGPRGITKS